MPRLSRKQIIAIILKKKGLLSTAFSGRGKANPLRSAFSGSQVGIHQAISESRVHRFLRAYMKTAPVEKVVKNSHQGSTESWIVKLKGGQTALFKAGPSAFNEHLAYNVDRIMGFNRIPAVVTRSVKVPRVAAPKQGILMQWIKSSSTGSALPVDSRHEIRMLQEFQEMRLFDYIIGNNDRHLGNVLVSKRRDRKLIPIDQAYSFSWGNLSTVGVVTENTVRGLSLESKISFLPRLDRLIRKEKYLKDISVQELPIWTAAYSEPGAITATESADAINVVMRRARILRQHISDAIALGEWQPAY